MWADSLTEAEVEGTLSAADQLDRINWAAPLLKRTEPILARLRNGKVNRATYRANPLQPSEMSFLFEIRFAYSLAMEGVTAEYEYSTGIGNTTVDFKVNLDPPWLVELVSLHESDAFKEACFTSGELQGAILSTNATDPRKSVEGEIIKAQERIGEKLLKKQRPIKFPEPNEAIHMVMVDARGFLGIGICADKANWRQIMYGPHGLGELTSFWKNPGTGQSEPIRGLFEKNCPARASRVIQERLHFIGVVCERTFEAGEIKERSCYYCNPALFENEEEARIVLSHWPLIRTAV
uniref:Uncharacterized protein n=1 Tax=Desulfobacca acetoxidans TaxID=60893 RepID=A0A7C3ZDG7_9BACT